MVDSTYGGCALPPRHRDRGAALYYVRPNAPSSTRSGLRSLKVERSGRGSGSFYEQKTSLGDSFNYLKSACLTADARYD